MSVQAAPSIAVETDALPSIEDIGARDITSLVVKYRPLMRSKLVADDISHEMSLLNTSVAYTTASSNGTTTGVLTSPVPESAAEALADAYSADLAVE